MGTFAHVFYLFIMVFPTNSHDYHGQLLRRQFPTMAACEAGAAQAVANAQRTGGGRIQARTACVDASTMR